MQDSVDSSGDPDYKTITFCWDLTTACQYRCSYCYALPWLTKPQIFKYTNAWKSVLKRLALKSMPVFQVEILGGEPLLHVEINNILSSLSTIKNCTQVVLNTNTAVKSIDIQYIDKVKVSPSYHPESRTPGTFCNKIKMIQDIGYHDDRLLVNINIHNDTKYIDDYLYILKFCADNNIYAGANYLNSTETYECKYTKEFFKLLYNRVSKLEKLPTGWSTNDVDWTGISKYRHPGRDKVAIKINGITTYKSMAEIRTSKLNAWKGYKCVPLLWQIDPDGLITNECTNIPLKLDNSNIFSQITCPCVECGWCDVHYKSYKYRD